MKYIDWLKLSPQQFFTLFLFSAIALGLLTFASDGVLENLGLRHFRSDYRAGLGLTLILSVAGLLTIAAKPLFQRVTDWWKRKKQRNHLRDLNADERRVLRPFFVANMRKLHIFKNGTTEDLVEVGVLQQKGYLGLHADNGWQPEYEIEAWARMVRISVD